MIKFLFLTLFPVISMASTSSIQDTDIVSRTLNFILFAIIVYFLLRKAVGNLLKNRKDGIANQLEKLKNEISSSKLSKEKAFLKIKEASDMAKSIEISTQKEIELLKNKISKDAKLEVKVLGHHFEESLKIERKKAMIKILKDILDEAFQGQEAIFSKEIVLNMISKKVSKV